jgi:hypothetical protein
MLLTNHRSRFFENYLWVCGLCAAAETSRRGNQVHIYLVVMVTFLQHGKYTKARKKKGDLRS